MSDAIIFFALSALWLGAVIVAMLALIDIAGAAVILWQHLRRQLEWRRLDAMLRQRWPGLR